MVSKKLNRIIAITILSVFFTGCTGNKLRVKKTDTFKEDEIIENFKICPWEEGGSMKSLFDSKKIAVLNYIPPPIAYGIPSPLEDRHSKDNSYFTSRIDYAKRRDTIIRRKIDFKRATGTIVRDYLPSIEENEYYLKKYSFQEQKSLLGFGWIDKHSYSDIHKFLNEEQELVELFMVTPQIKDLLDLRVISYYYKNDTLEYFESNSKQRGIIGSKRFEFWIEEDFLYIYEHDSLVDVPIVHQATPEYSPTPLESGVGYLFKHKKLVAILDRAGNEICKLEEKYIERGEELFQNHYSPLLILLN